MGELGDDIAHRPGGDEQPGLLAEQLGGAGLERNDRRVVAEHIVADFGLGRRRRWALSAGALLASVLAVAFVALAAAATASALRESALGLQLAAAAVLAALAALVYGLTAAQLVAELRSGSAD